MNQEPLSTVPTALARAVRSIVARARRASPASGGGESSGSASSTATILAPRRAGSGCVASSLRDDLDYKTRKEAPVEVSVVEFEPRVAIADPAFKTRVDRIAGDQHVGSRGQVTRKNERSIIAHRLSSLAAPAWRRASCRETAALIRCRSGDISAGVTGRAAVAAARGYAGSDTAVLSRSATAMIVSY